MRKLLIALTCFVGLAFGQCFPNYDPVLEKMVCTPTKFPGTVSVGTTVPGARTVITADGINTYNVARESRGSFHGNMIDDFHTLTGHSVGGSGVTMALVTVAPLPAAGKLATTAIQLTVPPGVTGTLNLATYAQNIPRKVVTVWFEIADYTTLDGTFNSPSIYIAASGAYAQYGQVQGPVVPLSRNGLFSYTFTTWAETGAPAWGGMTAGKLQFKAATGATAVVTVHAVVANQSVPPTVTLIFDDGGSDNYTGAVPLLEKYGFKAGFSIIQNESVNNSAFYMTLPVLQSLYADGYDMLVHGDFAPSTYSTLTAYYADIQANQQYLVSNGMSRASDQYTLVGGNWIYNGDFVSIPAYLKANGFIAAYAVGQGFAVSDNPIAFQQNPYLIDRIAINAITTPASVLAWIDSVTLAGFPVVLMGHGTPASGATGNNINQADLDTILSGLRTRVNARQLDVVRPSDAVRIWGLK